MISLPTPSSFAAWKDCVRSLLTRGVIPSSIHWVSSESSLPLFPDQATEENATKKQLAVRMPPAFIQLAENIFYHASPTKWDILYSLAWRIHSGERKLLWLASDDAVSAANRMAKQVFRDAHKAKAFIRFLPTSEKATLSPLLGTALAQTPDSRIGMPWFLSFHDAEHRVLSLVAEFLRDRFNNMNWLVSTPHESLSWNGLELQFAKAICPSLLQNAQTQSDEFEQLWKTYYASTFNPARLNRRMMLSEMPMKYWRYLPEAPLIDGLINEADSRRESMTSHASSQARSSALARVADCSTLSQIVQELQHCQSCELHCDAKRVVPGEGSQSAKIVFIGEQPGDKEDQNGRPFVGPAGAILRKSLLEIGFSISDLYFSNVVKHFHFEQKGKVRLHLRPKQTHIRACSPWLHQELRIIRPSIIVCLGATAAKSIIGSDFKLTKDRGTWRNTDFCASTMATFHPAALLRIPDEKVRSECVAKFREDLARAFQQAQ